GGSGRARRGAPSRGRGGSRGRGRAAIFGLDRPAEPATLAGGMSRPEPGSPPHRSGPPGRPARVLVPFARPLRALLTCEALATGAIALWLFTVLGTVLPERDPQHVTQWTLFALGFLAYALLTLAFVVRGPHPALLARVVVALSLAAIGFGGFAVTRMLAAADSGSHFEGYLLVMGIVLAGHGLSALAYATLTALTTRRVRAA